NHVQSEWKKLRRLMSIRLDLLPLLCERVRAVTPSVPPQLLHELVALRAQSWAIRSCNGEKVNTELSISQKIHEIQSIIGKSSDVLLVATQREILEISKKIDEEVEIYNHKARTYQRLFQ